MKKTLVLGLCCSVAAVALAANPGKLSKVAAPTLDSKLAQPAKVAPVRHTPTSGAAPTVRPDLADLKLEAGQTYEQALYAHLKATGQAIPTELNRFLFPNQGQGAPNRNGGETYGSATSIPFVAGGNFADSGTTVGAVNDYAIGSFTAPAACNTSFFSGSSFGAGDVVYTFTLPDAYTVSASVCNNASYDSCLGIVDSNGSLVAVNDDGSGCSGFSSAIPACCLDPGTYYLIVDGYGTATGTFNLSVDFGASPCVIVDPCDNPAEVVCGGSYTGDTTGAPNIAGNAAPDHVYVFNSTQPQILTLSLCGGATWDTYLRIYDDCPNIGTQLAANDDFCGLQSELEYAVGVGTYYILMEGYGSNSGAYTLNVSCNTCSAITCTGADENEAGGNNGPNDDPVLFGSIDCGTTVCGTVATFGDTLRDLDWFELLLVDDGIVTVDLDVESFNGILFFVDSDAATLLYSADLNGFCEDETLTTECLPAGIYYVVAGPNGFSGVDVPANYGLSVSCETCVFVDPCDAFNAAVTTIGGFPYGATGSTVGAPDVLGIENGAVGYEFTLTETSAITFSACQPGSDFDIDTYIFDAAGPCGGTQLFYNDGNSGCSYAAWASEWTLDCTLGAGTYVLVLTGYPYGTPEEGNFEFIMDIASCACPPINCTGTDENEAGGNDGPNADPVLFGSIACGETVCGTVATFGDTLRDLDWFELVLANDAIVTANLDVESFNGILFLIDGDAATILASSDAAGFCGDEVLVSECLQAGTYYVVAGPNAFSGVDTPANYGLSVSCEACTWIDPYTTCQASDESADAWTAGTSEADVQGTNYVRAERFGGVVGTITAVDFRGLPLVLSGSWTACAEDPTDFNIVFYDLGMNVVASYTASITGVAGPSYAGVYPSMDYHFDLPAPLALATGHISIQGAGANTCWFLWMSSTVAGADGTSLLSTDGGATFTADTFDLNYCFTTVNVCDPVADLTITKVGPNVNLNWSASAGAISYNIYESVDAYTLGALVANVPATTTSFSIAGAKKFYIVKAVCP